MHFLTLFLLKSTSYKFFKTSRLKKDILLFAISLEWMMNTKLRAQDHLAKEVHSKGLFMLVERPSPGIVVIAFFTSNYFQNMGKGPLLNPLPPPPSLISNRDKCEYQNKHIPIVDRQTNAIHSKLMPNPLTNNLCIVLQIFKLGRLWLCVFLMYL